jgi:lipid II:glycine glycyltransferase (peptidoglycan interpeptide bridge formation enzyme)
MERVHLKQSRAYAKYMQLIGWETPRHLKTFTYIKRIPLTPLAVMKCQRVPAAGLDFEWLQYLTRQKRFVQSYIELADETRDIGEQIHTRLREAGFGQTARGMLPSKTILLDLTQKDGQLLAGMRTKTRYNIGLAERKDLTAEVFGGRDLMRHPKLLAAFEKLVRISASRGSYFSVPRDWLDKQLTAFGDDAYMVAIKKHTEWLAGAMYLISGDTVYYEYNGATDRGRHLMAPTFAVWGGMREAKRRKLARFDFGGVWDERVPKVNIRFTGFSRFKESFGGMARHYPLPYMKWGWR